MIEYFGVLETLDVITGDFAFVYSDGKKVIAARDPVGVRPLFYTRYARTLLRLLVK